MPFALWMSKFSLFLCNHLGSEPLRFHAKQKGLGALVHVLMC